jgi:hypothetical protein
MQSYPDLLRLSAVNQPAQKTLGYLVLCKPDRVKPVNRDQELPISIDFGTSSTVICCQTPSAGNAYERPQMLLLDPALARISCAMQREPIKALSRYFLPLDTIESPFPTIMQLSLPRQFEYPFLDANAYYQKQSNELITDLSLEDQFGHDLLADIKWQVDVNKRKLIEVYLEQLIVMTALHARLNGYSKAVWHFSYPLTTENAYGYISSCCEIVKRIQNERLIASGRVVSMTESEAAARHFLSSHESYEVNKRDLAVIDIGGGTSDIFLYTRAGQIQASVMLGARKMLINQLFENRGFFVAQAEAALRSYQDFALKDRLSTKLLGDPTALQNTGSRDRFTLFVETLFGMPVPGLHGKFGRALCMQLSYADGDQARKQVALLRTIIGFYIGAIYFYSGMLLRYLRDVKDSSEASIANVCLAGNGSNVLDWILNVNETGIMRQDINAINSQLFLNGAHLSGPERAISAIQSKARKEEAARGLLSQPLQLDNQPIEEQAIMKVVLTGLQLTLKDDDQSELVYPAQSNLYDISRDFRQTQIGRLRVSDYTELDDYIISFNKAYAEAIEHRFIMPIHTSAQRPLTASVGSDQELTIIIVKESIGDQVVQSICQTANSEQKNYESPFIIAVNKAVEASMLKKWRVIT